MKTVRKAGVMGRFGGFAGSRRRIKRAVLTLLALTLLLPGGIVTAMEGQAKQSLFSGQDKIVVLSATSTGSLSSEVYPQPSQTAVADRPGGVRLLYSPAPGRREYNGVEVQTGDLLKVLQGVVVGGQLYQRVRTKEGLEGYIHSGDTTQRIMSDSYPEIPLGETRYLSTWKRTNKGRKIQDDNLWTTSDRNVVQLTSTFHGGVPGQGKLRGKKAGAATVTAMAPGRKAFVTAAVSVYKPVGPMKARVKREAPVRRGARADWPARGLLRAGQSVAITGSCGSFWRVGTGRYLAKKDVDTLQSIAPPSELKGIANGITIGLNWKKSAGATDYVVFRKFDDKRDYRKIGKPSHASFQDRNAPGNRRSYYRVKARKKISGRKTGVSLMSERVGVYNVLRLDWPVRGVLTGRYGESRPGHRHAGLDIAVPAGTPVRASADGRITYAGPCGAYGNLVTVNHGDGIKTRYAHNSKILVRIGDVVKRGQIIARAGSTGRSTGPHCHFEVRMAGESKDPADYLS